MRAVCLHGLGHHHAAARDYDAVLVGSSSTLNPNIALGV